MGVANTPLGGLVFVDEVLRDILDQDVIVYIDSIFVYGRGMSTMYVSSSVDYCRMLEFHYSLILRVYS